MTSHIVTFRPVKSKASLNRMQYGNGMQLQPPADKDPAAEEQDTASAQELEQRMRKGLRVGSATSPFHSTEFIVVSRPTSAATATDSFGEVGCMAASVSPGGAARGPGDCRSRGRRPHGSSTELNSHGSTSMPSQVGSALEGLGACPAPSVGHLVPPYPTRFITLKDGPSSPAAAVDGATADPPWAQQKPQPPPAGLDGQGFRVGRGRPRRRSAPDTPLSAHMYAALCEATDEYADLSSPPPLQVGAAAAAACRRRLSTEGAAVDADARQLRQPRQRRQSLGSGGGVTGVITEPGLAGYEDVGCNAFSDLGVPMRSSQSATAPQERPRLRPPPTAHGSTALQPSPLSVVIPRLHAQARAYRPAAPGSPASPFASSSLAMPRPSGSGVLSSSQRRGSGQLGLSPSGARLAPGEAVSPDAAHALLTQVCRTRLREAPAQEWTADPAAIAARSPLGSSFCSGVGWAAAAPGSPGDGAGSPGGRHGGADAGPGGGKAAAPARVRFTSAEGAAGNTSGGSQCYEAASIFSTAAAIESKAAAEMPQGAGGWTSASAVARGSSTPDVVSNRRGSGQWGGHRVAPGLPDASSTPSSALLLPQLPSQTDTDLAHVTAISSVDALSSPALPLVPQAKERPQLQRRPVLGTAWAGSPVASPSGPSGMALAPPSVPSAAWSAPDEQQHGRPVVKKSSGDSVEGKGVVGSKLKHAAERFGRKIFG